jgi:hypothetical protein
MVEMVESEKGNGGGWIAVGLTLLKSYAQCWGNENMGFFFFFFLRGEIFNVFCFIFLSASYAEYFFICPRKSFICLPSLFFFVFSCEECIYSKEF